jgi:hypothetical protein
VVTLEAWSRQAREGSLGGSLEIGPEHENMALGPHFSGSRCLLGLRSTRTSAPILCWDPLGLSVLVSDPIRALPIPRTAQTVAGAPRKLTGVGVTRLGITAAIALGAYAHALGELPGR